MRAFAWWLLAELFLCAAPVQAAPVQLDIPASDLGQALLAFSRQTGESVGTAGALPRHHVRRIKGAFDPQDALIRMVRGSGLRVVRAGTGLWRLEPAARSAPSIERPLDHAAEEIVVTGSKRDEALGTIPIAVSIVRPSLPDGLIPGRGLQELAGDAEGVFATNLGPGRDRLFLRGVADSAFNGPTQSTVSLFLDDARVSYATPDPDLRLIDIDHVEILRGPQGTLYGTGALGGIVRIVPRKPDLDHWGATAAIEGRITAHGATGGTFDGTINAPLVEDKLGLRLVGYAERTGGWIDDDGRSRKDVNDSRRYGGRAALRWKAAEDWIVDIGAVAQWIDADDSQYATRGLHRSTRLAEPHDNDFLAGSVTVRGVVADLDILSATAFVKHEVESRYDASAAAASVGYVPPLAYLDARDVRLFSQEWRLSDPSPARPWVLGATLLSVENSARGTFLPGNAPAERVTSLHNDTFEAALFGEASQQLGNAWTATLGVRAFLSKVKDELEGVRESEANRFGLTPSADLSWHPENGRTVWLRYAKAIRPGGLNPDGAPGLSGFRSDKLESLELGWRARVAPQVQIHGALFGLRWRNVQSDTVGTDGLVRTINAGSARNYGLEMSLSWKPGRFRIDGNATMQHARLSRPSAAAMAIGDDTRLPVVPDIAGRVRVAHESRLGAFDLTGFVAARYTGSARLSFDPGLAAPMGDYWQADAGLTLSRDRTTVSLTVTNILDSRGNSFGFGNPFSLRLAPQETPLRPRTIGLRIERRL
ncbi:TonB-dependent receptor [Rhizorhabdus sp. FW153]|uniref:TonB-dependent receptor n=1 Tax=Rhizorhabdus sp. FW153 TaxID=3400216 RepID=UPI003CECF35C